MRVVVLTGDHLRHRFVIKHVATHLDLAGVWQEQKPQLPGRSDEAEDDAVVLDHFRARTMSEQAFFAGCADLALPPACVHREVPTGAVNAPEEVNRIRDLAPDLAVVFGTGILKAPLIDLFGGAMINIHLGLSPYYRGSGTNFWAMANGEPEYVGATIHYLDAGVDSGPIIAHVRPELTVTDGPHTIGNHTITEAATAVVAAACAHAEGRVHAVAQWEGGRVYRRRDFCAEAVRQLRINFARGMIAEYLAHKEDRDRGIRLVTPRWLA